MSGFDDFAKALAGGLTRRQALRGIGVGMAGALLAAVGLGKKAHADPNPSSLCEKYCKDGLGVSGGKGNKNALGQCMSNCQACLHAGGNPCGSGDCCDPAAEFCDVNVCEPNGPPPT